MTEESLLENLLEQWDRLRRTGQTVDSETLCASCPQLLPLFRQKITTILEMERLLEKQEQTLRGELEVTVYGTATGSIVHTESRYKVLRSHACGGLGEVLLAHDEALGRPVALKKMRRGAGQDSVRRQRFLREAMITGQLDHPGIVSILSTGQDDSGQPVYVMKFIEGETLAEATRRKHQIFDAGTDRNTHEFLRVVLRPLLSRFLTICNTVAYAHDQGIIHRDLKPANMMLGAFGATYVVDWGLARKVRVSTGRVMDDEQSSSRRDAGAASAETVTALDDVTDDELLGVALKDLTGTGAVIGTPAYMSPEQASGQGNHVEPASDIYSLGATLYFLCTASAPVTTDDGTDWLDAVTRGRITRPRVRQPLIPESLESVCLKAMALNPGDRYSSVVELAADIERWLNDEPVTACRESWPARIARMSRRHRAWTQAGLLGLVVITILSTVFVWQLSDKLQRAETAERAAWELALEKSELAVREQTARKTADEQSSLALATLRSVIFRIARNLKNVEGAAEVRTQLLTTAIDGLAKVAKTLETRIEVDRTLLAAHNDIGKIYMFVGNLEKTDSTAAALHHFQKARDIGRQLLKESPEDSSLQRDVSVSQELIGDILTQMGRLDEADKSYAESLAISEQRLKATPGDIKCMQDAGFGYEKVADGLLTRGETASARPHLERCVELYTKIVALEPNNASYRRDLIVGQSKFGNVLKSEGQLEEAADLFEACVQGCVALEQIPDSGAQRRDRSVNLNKLGAVRLLQGKTSDALTVFGESLEVSRVALQADPQSVTARRDLTIVLNHMGSACRAAGNLEDARQHFLEGLPIRRVLATEDASNQVAQVDLARTLTELCDVEVQSRQNEKARVYLEEAESVLKPLSEQGILNGAEDKALVAQLAELKMKLQE